MTDTPHPPKVFVAIRSAPLSLQEALSAVQAEDVGGIAVFLGTVRNHNEGKSVHSLCYEAYESMAEKQMHKIAITIQQEVPGVRLAALHRVGSLNVGDAAVICVAAAAHREQAFVACRLLIDRIKQDVPIWKKEYGLDGSEWL